MNHFNVPPQWKWIKSLKRGDVVRSRNGVLRIVRKVDHSGPSLPKTTVCFAIRHCSWTHRCYTVYTGNDLRQMGYTPVAANMPLRSRLDRMIEADFGAEKVCLSCCDVIGIA